jgi:hypothetical protein
VWGVFFSSTFSNAGKQNMYLAYYDESGDDGFPAYSSPIFVLTALYIFYLNWKDCYETIHQFRQQIKKDYGLPLKFELHSKYFLLNKSPYKELNISDDNRIRIIDHYCDLLSQLQIKIVNVVINKKKISTTDYDILDKAFTYSIQRIENDLNKTDPAKRFLIITDEGRVGKMRNIARKIQRINYLIMSFAQLVSMRPVAGSPLPLRGSPPY